MGAAAKSLGRCSLAKMCVTPEVTPKEILRMQSIKVRWVGWVVGWLVGWVVGWLGGGLCPMNLKPAKTPERGASFQTKKATAPFLTCFGGLALVKYKQH